MLDLNPTVQRLWRCSATPSQQPFLRITSSDPLQKGPGPSQVEVFLQAPSSGSLPQAQPPVLDGGGAEKLSDLSKQSLGGVSERDAPPPQESLGVASGQTSTHTEVRSVGINTCSLKRQC